MLRADGNRVTRDGKPVILRGANVINYFWKYSFRPEKFAPDLAMLSGLYAEWKATAATVWFSAGPVLRNDVDFMAYLDGCMRVAQEHGAYLILAYASDEPNVGTHPYLISEDGIRAHQALARQYPDALHATQAEPGGHARTVSEWRALRDRQERTIDAIREVKPDALVFVSGSNWSQDVSWMIDHPVRRDNIVVKPHIYQGRNAGTTAEETLQRSGTLDLAQDYPIMIGEFGWGGRSTEEDVWVLIEMAERSYWGWQAWNLNDEGRPCLLRSKNAADRTPYGEIVYREMRRLLEVPFFIDCGAEAAWTAASGVVWEPDQPWSEQALHGYLPVNAGRATHGGMTERWGIEAYMLRLPEGDYDVDLHFAETWSGITGPGQRVFDVHVKGDPNDVHENDRIFLGIDPFKQAGFGNMLVKTAGGVTVTEDNILTIEFGAVTQNPAIKAIIVRPANGQSDELTQAQNKIRALQRVIARARATLAEAEE